MIHFPLRHFGAMVASLALMAVSLPANVHLASPFTDHMVLQRDLPVPVWGTAEPADSITVAFAGQVKSVTVGAEGNWRVELDPLAASAEGQTLTVTGSHRDTSVAIHDVLVGEVWLASGQSNMDFTVAKTEKYYFAGVLNEAAEVAAANHPLVRMFTGAWTKSCKPQTHIAGMWKICTPENVREFSAIAYFFACDLQHALNVPVGVVTLTYGASTAQAWIRREAIAANPLLKPSLDAFDAKVNSYTPPTEAELKEWQVVADQAKAAGKRPPRRPKPDPVQDQHNPTVMFNGMIAPFVGYAIRGVIWYQGESITAPRDLFPLWNETLITDWRKLWGRSLPFYFCQLAAHDNQSNSPQVRAWQAEALHLPNTGMAVTIDVGDAKNVHPKNKAPVGDRLSRIALAKVYGQQIEYSGPVFESMTVDAGTLRLKFSHVDQGLIAKDGPLQTFEIAGADGKFLPAMAKIDGDSVVVQNDAVSAPTTARYAWANYPAGCNLTNSAGLPAAPFSTTTP
ncbi:MAG TPA: sialate O-acetylesterase [Lacunisphaera sp.]